MSKFLFKLLLSVYTLSFSLSANANEFNWLRLFAQEKAGYKLVTKNQFLSHYQHLTRLSGGLLKGFVGFVFDNLSADLETRSELDIDHLRMVEIFYHRILSNSRLWQKYSLGEIVAGLHLLVAKYNIDIYDEDFSAYKKYFNNQKLGLKYLKNLEGELCQALDFSLHISDREFHIFNMTKIPVIQPRLFP